MTHPDQSESERPCDAFLEIEGYEWAGTYCKRPAGHDGPCSPHYPAEVASDEDFPRGGVGEQLKEVGSGADHKNAGAEPRVTAGEDRLASDEKKP